MCFLIITIAYVGSPNEAEALLPYKTGVSSATSHNPQGTVT